jgi:hypothetical protein
LDPGRIGVEGEAALRIPLESPNHGEDAAAPLAWVYAALGDKEPAFAWLEKAYRNHEGGLILLGVAPVSQPIRHDPRFESLLRRMGLAAISQPTP